MYDITITITIIIILRKMYDITWLHKKKKQIKKKKKTYNKIFYNFPTVSQIVLYPPQTCVLLLTHPNTRIYGSIVQPPFTEIVLILLSS